MLSFDRKLLKKNYSWGAIHHSLQTTINSKEYNFSERILQLKFINTKQCSWKKNINFIKISYNKEEIIITM